MDVFSKKRSGFRFVVVFLLFILPNTGAVSQTFRTEVGAAGNFIWLSDGASFPENGIPAPGAELGLSLYFGKYVGISATSIVSFPIENDASPPLQMQAFAGPSFPFRMKNFAITLTPAFYIYLLLPNGYASVMDYGAGVNVALEYHMNRSLYFYGKASGVYCITGSNFALAPAFGMGFKVNDHTPAPEKAGPVQPALVKAASAEAAPAQPAPAEAALAKAAPAQPAAAAAPNPIVEEYFSAGLEAYKAKDYDAAIAAYTKALNIEPDNAELKKSMASAINSRGVSFYKAKNKDAAAVDFAKALHFDPANMTAKKNLERVQAEMQPAAAAAPDPRVQEYISAGLEAQKAKDYDAAIAAYTKALKIEPDNAELKKNLAAAFNSRGVSSYKAKNKAAAAADFTEALRLDPTNRT
ncbi:MAG: tetratricopeptide repeat protein, partial [Treponema sp.]|nr:tetratricopeptide repeat protein [Treponema sp.]